MQAAEGVSNTSNVVPHCPKQHPKELIKFNIDKLQLALPPSPDV